MSDHSCIDNQFPWKVHFGIMKRFYCRERMFVAKSHETLVVQPPRNPVILYRISRDGVLRNHWSRITKDARLQEPNSVFSEKGAVPRLDTLSTKY